MKTNDTMIDDLNTIITGDSITVMKEFVEKYPDGIFDTVIADPPYNLNKGYSNYDDNKLHDEYVKWCDEWTNLICDIVRPGGSVFILNIPKWAVYHAHTLNKRMIFRNWIVWDALSYPVGKILPAHYTLLYYTKPNGNVVQNYDDVKTIPSSEFCIRPKCMVSRKLAGIDDKTLLTDIWHDILRIKHKKYRDEHPCQLPPEFVCRIINYSTNVGDTVYDPFGGVGTTAMAAKECSRNYVISDIDPNYTSIAQDNIKNVQLNLKQLF